MGQARNTKGSQRGHPAIAGVVKLVKQGVLRVVKVVKAGVTRVVK